MRTDKLHPNCGVGLSGPDRLSGDGRRGGFSLIELVVAIGVLTLMMALVGQIFTVTIQSTGEANSLIEVNQSLRLLEETLRADLRDVNPAESMMIISANPIDAYWTADQASADPGGDPTDGFPHDPDPERENSLGIAGGAGPPYRLERPRADVLMFFTRRVTASTVCPDITPGTIAYSQAVYGHAELNELSNANPPAWVNPWTVGTNVFPPQSGAFGAFERPAASWHLARRNVLIAPSDQIAGVCGVTDMDIPDSPDEPMPGGVLSEGIIDIIANDDNGELFMTPDVIDGPPPPFETLLHWMRRSRMDLTPPPAAANRLGHYFLPRCASFKVEWGFSDLDHVGGEILWVDPADIAGSVLRQYASAGVDPGDIVVAPFTAGGRFDPAEPDNPPPADWSGGTTHMFFSHDFPDNDSDRADPFFPQVLRITVDVFDRAGKFSTPFRHVMIIPVGDDS